MGMRTRILVTVSLSCFLLSAHVPAAFGENPIIQTKFTADPAPLVYNDTVYLYTSHDEDNATGFTMYNYLLYTSTDMVNWTDHGIVAGVRDPYKTWKWADGNNAWAPQVAFRNNKFYMYAPFPKGGRMMIGVAVADKPTGPFVDPLNGPLINNPNSTGNDIDPTVLIDDDGQAYMYWGHQPPLHYVKLNQDMISYSGNIVQLTRPQTFEEGPWLFKRDKRYYLAWASTCCPEGIGYAMSDSPTGPWTYKGSIMDGDNRSSGNHPGIIDYKGITYVFGFNYAVSYPSTVTQPLPGNKNERRSVCVQKLNFAADGTIPKLPFWDPKGVEQIGPLNPYVQTEAETIAWSQGLKTEPCSEGGMNVTNIDNGEFIKVAGVDFGAGATSLDVRVASAGNGGKIEVRLDSQTGPLVGTCTVSNTGDAQTWTTKTCPISGASGVHHLYFVFTGGSTNMFNFNWWKFSGTPSDGGTSGQGGNDGGTPAGGATGTGAGGAGGTGTGGTTGNTRTSSAAGGVGPVAGGLTGGTSSTTVGGRSGSLSSSNTAQGGQAGSTASGGVSSKAGAGGSSIGGLGGLPGGGSPGTTAASSSSSTLAQGGMGGSSVDGAGGNSQSPNSTVKDSGASGCSCDLGRHGQGSESLAMILLCLAILLRQRIRHR